MPSEKKDKLDGKQPPPASRSVANTSAAQIKSADMVGDDKYCLEKAKAHSSCRARTCSRKPWKLVSSD